MQDVYWAPSGNITGDATDAAVDATVPKDVYFVPEGNHTGDASVLSQPSDAVDLDAAAAKLDASLKAAVEEVDSMLGSIKSPAGGESLPLDSDAAQEAATPLLAKLQAVLDSLKGKSTAEDDAQLDYALGQLQDIQRRLQGGTDKVCSAPASMANPAEVVYSGFMFSAEITYVAAEGGRNSLHPT